MLNRLIAFLLIALLVFICASYFSIGQVPESLGAVTEKYKKPQVLDRSGKILSVTYENEFNVHSESELSQIPELVKAAFIISEDKRFYEHHGVDWLARFNAVSQRFKGVRRGASTISEQVIRMINPRPRTIWSRWIEGFEARRLERTVSKREIINFYLNQVPFAARRRGVQQAALYYFDRSLNTLSNKEMLALAVLVRAPNRLNLNSPYLQRAISSLVLRLKDCGKLSDTELHDIENQSLILKKAELDINASQFVEFTIKNSKQVKFLKTTLDANLQQKAQDILEERLVSLKSKNVSNGAILVIENSSASVLAWVNARENGFHDAVRIRRQAGSTLKPFLYVLALKKGWNAATIIEDAPIDQAVGRGLHAYKNYSRTFYGPLRLREALGNSLNSTAIRTIGFVGTKNFLNLLRELEFKGIDKSAEFYGDGIALGNAEVSLYELVQAYRVLANKGEFNNINFNFQLGSGKKIFDQEISSLVADILSDSQARRLEFSAGGVLSMPVPTAVKTGTSNDFRDAWAIGFTSTHTVGVWIGNLNREAMSEVSGARGPAYVLRSVFAEINRFTQASPLYLSPALIAKEICSLSGELAGQNCQKVTEWFVEPPTTVCNEHHKQEPDSNLQFQIKYPTPGLNLAMDPRIPDDKEAFEFRISGPEKIKEVVWILDGEVLGHSTEKKYLWNLKRGAHRLKIEVIPENSEVVSTDEVGFVVK